MDSHAASCINLLSTKLRLQLATSVDTQLELNLQSFSVTPPSFVLAEVIPHAHLLGAIVKAPSAVLKRWLAGADAAARRRPLHSSELNNLRLRVMGLHRSEGSFGVHPDNVSVLCNRDRDSTSPLNKVRWQADGVPCWMLIGCSKRLFFFPLHDIICSQRFALAWRKGNADLDIEGVVIFFPT